MSHLSRFAVLLALAVSVTAGAVPSGAAQVGTRRQRAVASADLPTRPRLASTDRPAASVVLPSPVRFKETDGRGYVVDVWVNNAGPFAFAIDTGAGGNLISSRVVREANVQTHPSEVKLGGLSGAGAANAVEADSVTIAVGRPENRLPSAGFTVVAAALPPDLDGILDPTEAYYPLGFVLDMPGREIRAFDPDASPVSVDAPPANGAVVEWISEEGNRRPFVRLADGRKALLDTGSRFGLAIGEQDAAARGISLDGRDVKQTIVNDIGGGHVTAHRVRPTSIQLGPMTLSNVPTDVLSGTTAETPTILGREALRPFSLTFDPKAQLIGIAPRS
jgi:predicted aspartyl protease